MLSNMIPFVPVAVVTPEHLVFLSDQIDIYPEVMADGSDGKRLILNLLLLKK